MATNKQSTLNSIELAPLYTSAGINTNENPIRESLKEAIYKGKKGKSSQKESDNSNSNSLNRFGKRGLKKTIKKAIESESISLLYPVCCGVDVHKDIMVACMRTVNDKGEKLEEIREFRGSGGQGT